MIRMCSRRGGPGRRPAAAGHASLRTLATIAPCNERDHCEEVHHVHVRGGGCRDPAIPATARRLLLRQIKAAGLLERRTGYYVRRIAVTTALLAAGWTAFVLVGDSWWQLAVAVFLAFVFTQFGLVGHEVAAVPTNSTIPMIASHNSPSMANPTIAMISQSTSKTITSTSLTTSNAPAWMCLPPPNCRASRLWPASGWA